MSKIVLEIEEFAKTHSEYKIFDQDCIRIGRGFDNDLIINDPFVAALHITLRFSEGHWSCEDNQSANGVFILSQTHGAKKTKVNGICPIVSGDTLLLGKTCIHLWGIDHPVALEQPLGARASALFDAQKTVPNLVINLGIFCFINYLNLSQWIWKSSDSFFQIITETFFLLFCFVIWSGIWALITRFTKRQHRFFQHLIFSLQWAVISLALSFSFKYVFFFACNFSFFYVVSLAVFALFGVFVLNNHLNIATNLSSVKRITISSLIMFSVVLLSVLGFYATRNEFSPDPHHYINIVPVAKQLIPSIGIDEEINRLDSIF